LRAAGIDGELESKDGLASAGFIEDVSILLDEHFDLAAGSKVDVGSNFEMFIEFGCVAVAVTEMDVSMSRLKNGGKATNGFTKLGEEEKVAIDIIAVIKGDVAVVRFRTPDFRGDVDQV
jgi:hypothetical protein